MDDFTQIESIFIVEGIEYAFGAVAAYFCWKFIRQVSLWETEMYEAHSEKDTLDHLIETA